MITLGYWAIRGRAEPTRYLLHFLGISFNDKRYTDPEEWFKKDKFNLGLDFPNLPYFIDADDGVKLTESIAIPRYICSKWGSELLGKTLEDKARIEQFLSMIIYQSKQCSETILDKQNFEAKSGDLMKKLETFLTLLEKEFEGQTFINGEKVCLVDFFLYEMLELAYLIHPGAKSMFKNLANMRSKFEELPGIKEYRSSSKFNVKVLPPSLAAVNT